MDWCTETIRMHLTDDGILIINPRDDFKGPARYEHVKINIDIMTNEIGSKAKGFLAYLPSYYIAADAHRYQRENMLNIPSAFVGDSFLKKMIGNFFVSLKTSSRPMKMFTNDKEAINWLKDKLDFPQIPQAG